MPFPTTPSNGDQYTTVFGTLYEYNDTDDKWKIISSRTVDVTSDLLADGDFEGHVLNITNAVAFGLPVYASANNTVAQADADALSTMPPLGLSVGTNKVLIQGSIREDDWAWTANDKIFISDTGTLTTTAPSGSGDVIHCVGIALNPNVILVKTFDWVIHT